MFGFEKIKEMIESIDIDELLEYHLVTLEDFNYRKNELSIGNVEIQFNVFDNKIEELTTLSLEIQRGNNDILICLKKTFDCFSFIGIEYESKEESSRYFESERSKLLFALLTQLVEDAEFSNSHLEDCNYSVRALIKDNDGEIVSEVDVVTPEMVAVFLELYNEYQLEFDEIWYHVDYDSITSVPEDYCDDEEEDEEDCGEDE